MDTTVSLNRETRDELSLLKEQRGLPHYDATVAWLIDEVNANN
jgi:hypothetical protein